LLNHKIFVWVFVSSTSRAPALPAPAAPAMLTGRKRSAEGEPHRDGAGAAGGAGGGAGGGTGVHEAPCADVTPALRPQDVHVLLADDEKISRLVTSKLLRRRARAPCAPRASPLPRHTHMRMAAPPATHTHA
jgi:hypothetical protein